jgi:CBS-domain-containing membrane protein
MLIDDKIKSNWKSYVIQSGFTALSVFIIILILEMEHAVVIASIGATAFIVFAMPNNITAKPKKIIGGHIAGLITGSFFAVFTNDYIIINAFFYAAAVGVTFLIMVITDTEHPPAAGTALGLSITGYSSDAAIAVLTSVIILSFIHLFAKSKLKDLVFSQNQN